MVASRIGAWVVVGVITTGVLPTVCSGQDRYGIARPRFTVGPLGLHPNVVVSDGIDTNVFNHETNQQQDFFLSFRPRLQSSLDAGRLNVTALSGGEFVYFQQFASERAINSFHKGEARLRLSGVTLFGGGSLLRTRERTGYEIDARAPRLEKMLTLGTDVSLGAKTSAEFRVFRASATFDDGTAFRGTSLREALNRREEGVRGTLRYAITPLTTLWGGAELQQDRFELSLYRDADSAKAMAGLEFKPLALLVGRVSAGYRRLQPRNSNVPNFAGLVGEVDLGITVRNATRFTIRAQRDVMFSFEPQQPYYVLSDAGIVVRRQIVDRWDAEGSIGTQRLEYQGAPPFRTGISRTDIGTAVGAATGVRLLDATRVAFTAYYARRRSGVADRAFEGYRFGSSIEYGF